MPTVFNLKHAAYAGSGAAVGGIIGYMLGIVLFVTLLSSSAFVVNGTPQATQIDQAATSAGIFPILFALLFAAIGFFSGFYTAVNSDEQKEALVAAVSAKQG